LHLVFAEKDLSTVRRRADHFWRLAFSHRQQPDGICFAPATLARRANLVLDFFKVFSQAHGNNRKSQIANRK
jgi:hypothetical protein